MVLENGSHYMVSELPNQITYFFFNTEQILTLSKQTAGILQTRLLQKLKKTREAERRLDTTSTATSDGRIKNTLASRKLSGLFN